MLWKACKAYLIRGMGLPYQLQQLVRPLKSGEALYSYTATWDIIKAL